MSENKELKEELLEEVTGGIRGDGKGALQSAKEAEKHVIDDAKKKIAATAKAGKAINDAGEKKVAQLPWF